ncbi:MAG: hypothetical protein JKY84_04370 [Emcibacteraceae bacterium]|nr:hypothetical protein [Emcibacteraceae bacterium]
MSGLAQYKDLIEDQQHDFDSLLPLCHKFKYDGLTFECQLLHNHENDGYIINLVALLGHLPYSAENNEKRRFILQNLGSLMAQGIVVIDRHCKLTLPLKTLFKGKLSTKILMENIVYTLLDTQDTLCEIRNTLCNQNKIK